MVARPFYSGSLLTLSYVVHSTWCTATDKPLVAIYIQRPAQFSFFITDIPQFYQGMMVMIIKHDKVNVLNPCDDNKMIVYKITQF